MRLNIYSVLWSSFKFVTVSLQSQTRLVSATLIAVYRRQPAASSKKKAFFIDCVNSLGGGSDESRSDYYTIGKGRKRMGKYKKRQIEINYT